MKTVIYGKHCKKKITLVAFNPKLQGWFQSFVSPKMTQSLSITEISGPGNCHISATSWPRHQNAAYLQFLDQAIAAFWQFLGPEVRLQLFCNFWAHKLRKSCNLWGHRLQQFNNFRGLWKKVLGLDTWCLLCHSH